jgi:hypothetical protein
MTTKISLLTGTAVGVFLATGAAAQAAPTAHEADRAPAAASAAAARQAAEIEALKAQVESLSERLAATEQQQRKLQDQAVGEVQTLPDVAKPAAASATPNPKPSWADSTQVSGRMYFDLTNLKQTRDGAKVAPSGVGFDVKRFYLGVDHRFNDTWSANLTTDVAYVSGEGLTQVYVKKAYLQAKLSDAAVIRFGSADMPWVPFAEDVYGYRFVEPALIDRTKFGTSADWGVHVGGKLAGGLLNYAVSVVDGAGYKNPVRSKGMDVEGRVSLNYDGVVLGLGGYSGKLGKDVQGGPPTRHTATRFDALAAYVQPRFRIGAEYYAASDWNTVTAAASDRSDGYSIFGSYNVTPQVSVFGRHDWVKPSKDLNPSEKENYFNVGVNWQPAKIVDLALVYKRGRVDRGLFSTSNGVIGGVDNGTYDEIGLWGQLRW